LQLLPEGLQIVYVFTDHCMLYCFSEVHKQKLAEYLLLYSVLERVYNLSFDCNMLRYIVIVLPL